MGVAKCLLRILVQTIFSCINTMTYNIEEAFKDPQYLGIGRGFTMSVTMNDVQDYCDDFSNNQTESI